MTTHLTPELARAYLDELCDRIDRKQPIGRPPRSWWKLVGVPVAVGMSIGAVGCGGKAELPPPGTSQAEVCNDKKDNDNDGKIDCADADCQDDAACQVDGGAVYAAPVEVCNDQKDNDSDGKIDCLDPDCASYVDCTHGVMYGPPFEDCTDGVDNDGDGAIDCSDSDCAAEPICNGMKYGIPMEICDDGVDNDNDGAVDCNDSDCQGYPDCIPLPYMAPFTF